MMGEWWDGSRERIEEIGERNEESEENLVACWFCGGERWTRGTNRGNKQRDKV